MDEWVYPIFYATLISSAMPVVFGLLYFRRIGLDVKLLTALFALVLLIDLYSLYCARRHVSGNWVHHYYTPIEYAIFGVIISTWLSRKFEKKAVLFSVALFVALCIWDIATIRDWMQTNDFTASVACTLFIGMTSYTLLDIDRRQTGPLYKNYRFWLLAGLLLYSAGSLTFFVFLRHIVSWYLWAGHNALNIIANVFYTIGIVCQGRRE